MISVHIVDLNYDNNTTSNDLQNIFLINFIHKKAELLPTQLFNLNLE